MAIEKPAGNSNISSNELKFRYLELLKHSLTRSLDAKHFDVVPESNSTPFRRFRSLVYRLIQTPLSRFNLALVQTNRPVGETMMGMGALDNLHMCLEAIQRDGIAGDLIETGVWRGGGTIFMRGFLIAHSDEARRVWVADSFEGLPPPKPELYHADKGDQLWKSDYLAVSQEEVESNFRKYDLLDDRVMFLKGFFSDTMPTAPIEKLSLIRLDGDMYESTIVVLRNLYHRLSNGGFVIIDDYGMIPGCNDAVRDFRDEEGITAPLQIIGHIDGAPLGAYWRK